VPIRRLVATLASSEARLDRFLHTWLTEQLRSPVSKAQVRRWLMAGAIRVDGIGSRRPARPLRRGTRIEVRLDPNQVRTSERPPELGGRILYEDAALIAVDKPAGLAMHPSADRARPDLVSGLALLLRDRGQRDYLAVHQRLDRETSGVVLLAKLEAANSGLAASFAKREVVKLYQALTRRCLATMQEVAPLAAVEIDRPRMTASDLKPLVATKRA